VFNFVLSKSFPANLTITAIGVIIIKYIKAITIGEIIFPNNSPNFIQALLRGIKALE
jgi:hypothetical protein